MNEPNTLFGVRLDAQWKKHYENTDILRFIIKTPVYMEDLSCQDNKEIHKWLNK